MLAINKLDLLVDDDSTQILGAFGKIKPIDKTSKKLSIVFKNMYYHENEPF